MIYSLIKLYFAWFQLFKFGYFFFSTECGPSWWVSTCEQQPCVLGSGQVFEALLGLPASCISLGQSPSASVSSGLGPVLLLSSHNAFPILAVKFFSSKSSVYSFHTWYFLLRCPIFHSFQKGNLLPGTWSHKLLSSSGHPNIGAILGWHQLTIFPCTRLKFLVLHVKCGCSLDTEHCHKTGTSA